jgi:hypothetical protein
VFSTSVNTGPETVDRRTMSWTFGSETCRRGTRTMPLVHTLPNASAVPVGVAVQTGTEVTLTYTTAELIPLSTRTFPRFSATAAAQALPAVCVGDAPFQECNALTLTPGRGASEVRWNKSRRFGATVEAQRVVQTRTN